MRAVESDPDAFFRGHPVPVIGFHELRGAVGLNREVEVTGHVPAPPIQRFVVAAQAVFRRENIGRAHRFQRKLPAGETGAALPVRVIFMRPVAEPGDRRPLVRDLEVKATRGSGGSVPARSPLTARCRWPSLSKVIRH